MDKKHFFIIVLILISNCLFSQTQNKIFLSNLLSERIIEIKDKINNKESYNIDNINIGLDSLSTSDYSSNYIKLYKFSLGKNSLNYDNNKFRILFNSSYCKSYVIAIDSENNSYKLSGFQKNDILYFVNMIKKKFNYKTSVDALKFLKNNIDDFDFDCIYKSVKEEKLDSKCVIPCSEGISSH
jgi:archaellum component FlaG (FlaF/FlaG flagellin family)